MPTLSPAQVQRIEAVAAILADVAPPSVQRWLTEFATEADPEKQIQTWERYARVYSMFTQPGDPPKRKREVLQMCLTWTPYLPTLSKDETYETLTEAEVDRICAELARL